ncbi:hypothetical protein HAP41_0000002070 [Bradyrhizobium barranii subsp. apii]|uniref:Uncharacterized protein n=1 Tax=Bradyrhizobium barranii subsp. apii TaxID=2819348 RepID=A0A8T5UZ34_9BRAD|nr:hypothetical protein [Bradyrhizobium barranii]UPT87969.1 hypothetical protein HAP41_0000002070 [Bradyrhizobium barranii subsp. apii]
MSFEPGPANPQPFSAGVYLQSQLDVIEWLPPAAAERLRLLRQRAADAHRLIPEFETVREASMARIEAENRLKTLLAHPQDFGRNLKPDDPLVKTATKHLEKMTTDLKRLTELREVRSAAWQAASAALVSCENWLRDGRPHGTTLEEIETEPPKLNKGEDVLSGIERFRRRVRELRADLHRIASAPYPSSHAKAKMRAQVEALAQRGAPSVSRLVELDGPVDFQMQSLTSEVHAERRSLAFTETADALALVAWLHRDALIAALDREISTEADDKAALSHEARQVAASEAQGDLIDIERQEAELVASAQIAGLPIEHRGDINPLALLGLRLITAPRPDASPETSPGLSWLLRR